MFTGESVGLKYRWHECEHKVCYIKFNFLLFLLTGAMESTAYFACVLESKEQWTC